MGGVYTRICIRNTDFNCVEYCISLALGFAPAYQGNNMSERDKAFFVAIWLQLKTKYNLTMQSLTKTVGYTKIEVEEILRLMGLDRIFLITNELKNS